jgi:hypothetical protein
MEVTGASSVDANFSITGENYMSLDYWLESALPSSSSGPKSFIASKTDGGGNPYLWHVQDLGTYKILDEYYLEVEGAGLVKYFTPTGTNDLAEFELYCTYQMAKGQPAYIYDPSDNGLDIQYPSATGKSYNRLPWIGVSTDGDDAPRIRIDSGTLFSQMGIKNFSIDVFGDITIHSYGAEMDFANVYIKKNAKITISGSGKFKFYRLKTYSSTGISRMNIKNMANMYITYFLTVGPSGIDLQIEDGGVLDIGKGDDKVEIHVGYNLGTPQNDARLSVADYNNIDSVVVHGDRCIVELTNCDALDIRPTADATTVIGNGNVVNDGGTNSVILEDIADGKMPADTSSLGETIPRMNELVYKQKGNGITTTLWASPEEGDNLVIINRGGGSNTISGNGNNIEGSATTTINDDESFSLVYINGEWLIY